jgi:phage/plasmid-like protein (TIGR03299 family)
VTDTVCDNTRELALAETGQQFKVKHSRHSRAQLAPARQALAMVHTLAGDFIGEIQRLCATPVSAAQWRWFLDRHAPRTDPATSRLLEGRALTHIDGKRDRLEQLYRADPRVSPWAGTAHGVIQAVNTYEHHEATIRGDRHERNGMKTLTGEFGKLDRTTWQTLLPILNGSSKRA